MFVKKFLNPAVDGQREKKSLNLEKKIWRKNEGIVYSAISSVYVQMFYTKWKRVIPHCGIVAHIQSLPQLILTN